MCGGKDLPIFVCPYKLTHVSNFFSGKYGPYTRNKAIALVSFGLKVGFFFKPKSLAFMAGSLSEKHQRGLSGSRETGILSFGKWG